MIPGVLAVQASLIMLFFGRELMGQGEQLALARVCPFIAERERTRQAGLFEVGNPILVLHRQVSPFREIEIKTPAPFGILSPKPLSVHPVFGDDPEFLGRQLFAQVQLAEPHLVALRPFVFTDQVQHRPGLKE